MGMLKITKESINQIIKHARTDAPVEACGYLGEKNGVAWGVFPMENIDASGEHFSLNPEEQFSVIRNMREMELKPAAVYHSHPETPARPSEEDIRLAYDPEMSYVIVSLAGTEPSVKSFRIRNGKVDPEKIEIIN